MNRPEKTSARVIRLETWRQRRAHRTTTPSAERLGYRIAGAGFLVGQGVREDVLVAPVLFPVPNTPVWSRGLANYHGKIVPVFDLGIFIGSADNARETHTVLILAANDQTAGFVIDQPPQPIVAETAVDARLPLNAPALRPFLGACLHAHDADWWEFDYHGFLLTLAGTHPGE